MEIIDEEITIKAKEKTHILMVEMKKLLKKWCLSPHIYDRHHFPISLFH
jgi:hypothetical protein